MEYMGTIKGCSIYCLDAEDNKLLDEFLASVYYLRYMSEPAVDTLRGWQNLRRAIQWEALGKPHNKRDTA